MTASAQQPVSVSLPEASARFLVLGSPMEYRVGFIFSSCRWLRALTAECGMQLDRSVSAVGVSTTVPRCDHHAGGSLLHGWLGY